MFTTRHQALLRLLVQSRRRVFVQDPVIAEQSAALAQENEQSDRLLLNVLPERISTRLREGEHTIADRYPDVSVLFADMLGFTALVATSMSRVTGARSMPHGRVGMWGSDRS